MSPYSKLCLALLTAAMCGCGSDPKPDEVSDDPAPDAPAASAPADSIAKTQVQLVDARVELQKPGVVKVASGLDSGAKPQGLFGVGSNVMMTMLQTQVRLQRELNGGRNPTFAEFSQTIRQANVKLTMMPPWQMIGYDEDTGELSLLEDKSEKIRRYKAKNIPLDEDDKPYDTESNN